MTKIAKLLVFLLALTFGMAQPLMKASVSIAQTEESPINAVAWSPDSTRFATGDYDGNVKIWDVTSNQLLATFSPPSSLIDYSPMITSLAWHPDGTRIVASTSVTYSYGMIWILNAATGQIITSFEAGIGCFAVAWSPDGSKLAGAISHRSQLTGPYTIDIWNTTTGELETSLESHTNPINTIAWSPDGTKIASGSLFRQLVDGNVIIWDIANAQPLFTLTEHTGNINSVAWNSDGSRLASGDSDGSIRIWDPATGQQLAVLQDGDPTISSIDWRPDDSQLMSIGLDKVKIWDANSYQVVRTIEETSESLLDGKWSPDNTKLIYSGETLTEARMVSLPLGSADLHVHYRNR